MKSKYLDFIGQIDFYVKYFEENIKTEGDNPTIGIVLCSEKNETMVMFFASPFWTKLQNIFGHCCKSILDKVAKHWLALNRPAV